MYILLIIDIMSQTMHKQFQKNCLFIYFSGLNFPWITWNQFTQEFGSKYFQRNPLHCTKIRISASISAVTCKLEFIEISALDVILEGITSLDIFHEILAFLNYLGLCECAFSVFQAQVQNIFNFRELDQTIESHDSRIRKIIWIHNRRIPGILTKPNALLGINYICYIWILKMHTLWWSGKEYI